MNEFETQLIKQAFSRCYGLQNSLRGQDDELLLRGAIESLSFQSGLRVELIKNNLEEIRLFV